jgi:hypothetical protein
MGRRDQHRRECRKRREEIIMNFDRKSSLSADSVLAALQRKNADDAALKQNQQAQETNAVLGAAEATASLVSNMVEQSKLRQRRDFVKNLSELALRQGMTGEGPLTESQAQENALLSSAVMVNPDAAAKEILNREFATDKSFAPQQGAIELTDGRVIPAILRGGKYYYPNTDTVIPPETISGKGYKQTIISDPNSGNLVGVSGTGSGNVTGITSPSPAKKNELKNDWTQLTPLRKKAVDEAKAQFDSSQTVTAMTSRLQKFDETRALLETKNWVGDAALGAFVARTVATEVGNLNQQEQEIYRMSPEIIRNLKTKANRWMKGVITEEDRADIEKVVNIAEAKTIANLNREAEFHTKRLHARMKDVDPAFIKSNIYDEAYRPKTTQTTQENPGREAAKATLRQKLGL